MSAMMQETSYITQWIRPQVRAMSAYHVPDAADYIKLDAMENPYTWDESVMQDWLAVLREVHVNRYPHPSPPELKRLLRGAMDVPDNMEIVLGNGSDELIQMLMVALGGPRRSVVGVEPAFVMYRMLAQANGLDYIGVPLRGDDFSLDAEAALEAVARHNPALVFLAYPNNPTGNMFARADLERIIENAPGLVIIDEAYCAFAEDSFMRDLGRWNNLLVLRTLSKVGLAGLRLGMLAGPREWLEQIDKVRLPYNISVLSQAAAEFALKRYTMLTAQTERLCQAREQLYAALTEQDGIQAWPSQANFILFRVNNSTAVFNGLKEQGILIKNLHGGHPLLDNCLRVTVGRDEENQAFLQALKDPRRHSKSL